MSTKELIRKAARGRDVKLRGCAGFNRSAEKLEDVGEAALSDIESFLCDEIGSIPRPADELPDKPWIGLANVLHVYFQLAAHSKKVDAGQFLLSLHGWLREEAMRVVYVEWGPAQAPQRKLLPPKLKRAVERLQHAGSQQERDLAHRLLQLQNRLLRTGKKMAATHH